MSGSRRRSDYENWVHGNTPGVAQNTGALDGTMAQKHNTASDAFSGAIDAALEPLGYDGDRRTGTDDNDFYRDNAQYMPGWGDFGLGFLDPDGVNSGAWAQDRATNHVGHGTGEGNPWDFIRRDLVKQEGAMIDASLASGGDGKLSFDQVYDAHVNAYDGARDPSKGHNNGFIDPGSFALAVYAAPMLEHLGLDAGAVTGMSIDFFNDPTDSASMGWAKRMGLGLGELAIGGPLAAPFALKGMYDNTVTALDNGMLGEWGDMAGNAWDSSTEFVGDTWTGATDAVAGGWDTAIDAIGGGWDTVTDGAGGLIDGAGSAIASVFSGW